MRIIHFLNGRCEPDSANGIHKTVYHLSANQAQLGHRVGVFGVSDKSVIPLPHADVRNFKPSKLRFIVPQALQQAILQWKPDVINIHTSYTLETAGLARWLQGRGIPYVQTSHGNYSPEIIKNGILYKLPYKLFIQRPNVNRAMFVHSIADEADLRSYGITVPLVEAPNAFDFSMLPQPLAPQQFLEQYPQLCGKRIFMFVGRLDIWQKGLDILIPAFARAGLRDSALVLIGPSYKNSLPELQAMAATHDIQDQVVFTGKITGDAKFHALGAADVFVHPSRHEAGVPFSVLEAAATGTPCLLTAGSDPRGTLRDTNAAISVALTEDDIARGLREFEGKTPEALQDMGETAHKVIKDTFNWRRTTQTLLDAYEAYLNKRDYVLSY